MSVHDGREGVDLGKKEKEHGNERNNGLYGGLILGMGCSDIPQGSNWPVTDERLFFAHFFFGQDFRCFQFEDACPLSPAGAVSHMQATLKCIWILGN